MNGIICKDGDSLKVDKAGLLTILENNPDKKSRDIDAGLVRLVEKYYRRLSTKQTAWIFTKVGFIVRWNYIYSSLKGFKDILFL
jgi:hypothetical protein